MATLTIRLPDDKHLRLKKLAESQGLSINNLYRQYFRDRLKIANSTVQTKSKLVRLDQRDAAKTATLPKNR